MPPCSKNETEGAAGNLPYHDQGCNEGFNSSALYTTSFGFRNSWRLHFFTVNKLYWINSYFQ